MDRSALQNRLGNFAVLAASLIDNLNSNSNPLGHILARQLAKSSSSSALNYAESQFAESTKDFIHKLKVTLKELKETEVCLNLIDDAALCSKSKDLSRLKSECSELIAILISSINTVIRNNKC